MTEEDTFNSLRRVPFWDVMTYLAEEQNMNGQEENFCRWLSNVTEITRLPNADWIERYRNMGWEWHELVKQARKEYHDKMG